jgi:hypothetical protein
MQRMGGTLPIRDLRVAEKFPRSGTTQRFALRGARNT